MTNSHFYSGGRFAPDNLAVSFRLKGKTVIWHPGDAPSGNLKGTTRTLDGSLFKVKDSAGTEYEHSTRGSTAVQLSGGKTLFLKQCQPKIPTKGILVFEVPDQGHPYFLELSGGFWSGQYAQVALQ